MELHMSDNNLCLPSSFSITDSEIPSFEEAFDTESLRKFYRQKNPSIYSLKEFSIEEDTRSQTLESFSPMTPAQSNSFTDYFQAGAKDSWQDIFGRSNQGVDKGTLELLFSQRSQSQVSQSSIGAESVNKQQKSKQEEEAQDLIAKLCMEMQEYYQGSADKKNKTEEPVSKQVQQQAPVHHKKSHQPQKEKKTFYNKKEEELNNKVIKRLIQKKEVFKVHRKKGFKAPVPQVESPIMNNNFSIVQQQVTPQNMNIVAEPLPQGPQASYAAYPTYPSYPNYPNHPNYPNYPAVGYQENFVNQERRQQISFQVGPNMNFNMGNGYYNYNRGNIRVSNMNINMVHNPY